MKLENEPALGNKALSDNVPASCRGDDKAVGTSQPQTCSVNDSLRADSLSGGAGLPAGATQPATLPRAARLPINRCNLPAVVLGGLTYQRHPSPLLLDGVAELHADLFRRLALAPAAARPEVFADYMTVRFQLAWPEEVGYNGRGKGRTRANYVKAIRGWSFDSDSREGAVLKGWVESRFGLTPRYHREILRDANSEAYGRYLEMRSQGLYGTNALEAQLDLVYSYCQYELAQRHPGARHVTLYRGVNRLADYEILARGRGGRHTIVLNNLNSFSCSRERACEFGDYILAVDIPLSKIFFYCGLLPGVLQGEDEFLAIGGVADVLLASL